MEFPPTKATPLLSSTGTGRGHHSGVTIVAVFSHESPPAKSLHAPHERNAYTTVAGPAAVVFRLLRRLEQNGDIQNQ